jgi:hypothetical protein
MIATFRRQFLDEVLALICCLILSRQKKFVRQFKIIKYT